MSEEVKELVLHRDLSDCLEFPRTPEEYRLRWYQPGDREIWLRIHRDTGIYGPISSDLFDREFGDDTDQLRSRQCYLLGPADQPVGTATAWTAAQGRDAREGRVHWVAVVPDRQRQGLGSYLTRVVCRRLRELGAESAYLTTGSKNIPAIRMYLGLGFRPEIGSDEDQEIWRGLAAGADSADRIY